MLLLQTQAEWQALQQRRQAEAVARWRPLWVPPAAVGAASDRLEVVVEVRLPTRWVQGRLQVWRQS